MALHDVESADPQKSREMGGRWDEGEKGRIEAMDGCGASCLMVKKPIGSSLSCCRLQGVGVGYELLLGPA